MSASEHESGDSRRSRLRRRSSATTGAAPGDRGDAGVTRWICHIVVRWRKPCPVSADDRDRAQGKKAALERTW